MIAAKHRFLNGFVLAFGALIHLGFFWIAPTRANSCQGTLSEVFKQMQAVKFIRDDLVQSLRGQNLSGSYPWKTNPDHSKVFREFEDDYLKLIEQGDPTLLGATFKTKWGLTEIQFADVISFYSVHIWEDPMLSAFGQDARFRFVERLRFLHFADFIKNSNKSLAGVYSKKQNSSLLTVKDYFIYFHKNLTQMSAPQMAEDLNLSENEIYRLLSDLKISIDTKWQSTKFKNLFTELQAQQDLSAGTLTDDFVQQAAQRHKVGFEALKFYLHYLGSFQNGRPWIDQDVLRLKELRLKNGFSVSEIAHKLNRTEASVNAKLSNLGLVANIQKGAELIVQPPYGALKENGQIQVEALMKFILGTGFNNRRHLAELLEVQAESFDFFITRHKIDFLFDDFATRSPSPNDSIEHLEVAGFRDSSGVNLSEAQRGLRKAQKKFSTQREFIDKIVGQVLTFDGTSEANLKIDPKELLKTNKPSIEANFSGDPLLFLEALFSELELKAVAHRVNFWELSCKSTYLKKESVSEPDIETKLRDLQKRYSDFVILKFLKENPNSDLVWGNGGPRTPFETPTVAAKVMATGLYRRDGDNAHQRVYENPLDFWSHLQRKTKAFGFEIDITKIDFEGNYSNDFRRLLIKVWDKKILQFLMENPQTDLFWARGGPKTPFKDVGQAQKVMSTGQYRQTRSDQKPGKGAHRGVYKGSQHFWLRTYLNAKAVGIELDLTKVSFNGDYTNRFRQILIKIWDVKILKFIQENPDTDFSWASVANKKTKSPFDHVGQVQKVMGQGAYRLAFGNKKAGVSSGQRVHSGSAMFYTHIRELLLADMTLNTEDKTKLLQKLEQKIHQAKKSELD